MTQLLTMKEAAAILKISPWTVKRMIENGDIEAVLVSPSNSQRATKRIREDEVERYVREVGVYDPGV